MKFHRVLSLLLALCALCTLLCLPAAATEADELPPEETVEAADPGFLLQCGNAVLLDGNNGTVLYDQGAFDTAYPASMTKVMTALLVLEAMEDGTIAEDTLVTVSEYASQKVFPDESTANLIPGEQMSVKDLLYCLMLPSANDAAKALAEHLSGTCEAFAEEMNARAVELGCKNTHFVNPNGLHEDDHYSCAYDIALMYQAAAEYPLFKTIVMTPEYTTQPTNLSGERYFFNTNGLISNYYYSGYVYNKCVGGKTGSTTQAGKCLVSAAREGERLLISVVMGAGPITMEDGSTHLGQFYESTRLLEYGFANFRPVTLSLPDEPVAAVSVSMSEDGTEVLLRPRGSISMSLHNSISQNDIQTRITLNEDSVVAPVEEGTVMGSIELYCGDVSYGTLELVAERSLEYSKKMERQLKWQAFWEKNKGWIIGVPAGIILVPVALLLAIRTINMRRIKRRKQRAAQRRAAQQRRQRQQ